MLAENVQKLDDVELMLESCNTESLLTILLRKTSCKQCGIQISCA